MQAWEDESLSCVARVLTCPTRNSGQSFEIQASTTSSWHPDDHQANPYAASIKSKTSSAWAFNSFSSLSPAKETDASFNLLQVFEHECLLYMIALATSRL